MKKRKPKLAPRNPLVVPALQRKAGAHQKTEKALRRKEKVALNRCVAQGQSIRLLTDRREFDPLHIDQQNRKARFVPWCPEMAMAPTVNRRARKRTQVRSLPTEQSAFCSGVSVGSPSAP
jgi:hypothetical protein